MRERLKQPQIFDITLANHQRLFLPVCEHHMKKKSIHLFIEWLKWSTQIKLMIFPLDLHKAFY